LELSLTTDRSDRTTRIAELEAEVRRLEASLAAERARASAPADAEAKFHAIADSIDQMIWSTHARRLSTIISTAAGTNIPACRRARPTARNGTACSIPRTRSAPGRSGGTAWRPASPIRSNTGCGIDPANIAGCSAAPSRCGYGAGEIVRWYGTCTDITRPQDRFTGTYRLDSFGEVAAKAQRGGAPLVLRDNIAEIGEDEAATFLSIGIRATICLPLVKGGRLAAMMAVHSARPRDWTAAEVALIGEVTERCWAHVERVGAEAVLREASEREGREAAERATILGQLAEGVIVADAAGRITFVNECAEALHGVKLLGVGPGDYSETYHLFTTQGEPYPTHELPLARAIEHGETVHGACWRIRRPDGSEVIAVGSARPIVDEEGKRCGAVLTVRDDTARQHSDQALRESEERFRTLADFMPALCWWADASGYIYWYNRQWYEYTGTRPADMEGWGWQSVHDPDTLQDVMERWTRSIETGAPFEMTFPLKGADGSFRPFLTRIVPLRDSAGRVVRWFGTNVDVKAEKELEERLREESRTLETLNRTGASLAAQLDVETLVKMVTDAGVELTGAQFGAFFHNVTNEAGESYMLYTLSGAEPSQFDFGMPRATAIFHPTFAGEGVIRSDDITADKRYGLSGPHFGMPKGHLPVRSYLAVSVVGRSGEVIGGLFFGHGEPGRFTERHEHLMVGIAAQAAVAMDNARLFQSAQRELLHRERAERALRALNETLEQRVIAEVERRGRAEEALRQAQKMETLGQLTGGVAHDFNNLLQIVSGNLEILQRGLPEDAGRLRRAAENASRGAERAAILTQRLLAFSRRQPLAPKPVEANRLVAGMLELLHRSLGETIAVETSLASDLWPVEADSHQLENAILNLAVNARDAMDGGGTLIIETSNERLDNALEAPGGDLPAGDYVAIRVKDSGCGMDADTVARAFEPFFTTKEVGKGTGLGLSMVYGFAKQSGGDLQIDSELGRGTTVTMLLPRRLDNGVESETEVAEEAPERAQDEVILVCEDDHDVRAYTVEVLGELGYQVLEAQDGAAALALLEDGSQRVDLLFTDVVLPGGMTGAGLARAAQAVRPGLKLLYTTGYARDAIVHEGRLDTGVELITKPFSYSNLAAKVRDVLDARS
jgi:PAS domain S-box-containing protein